MSAIAKSQRVTSLSFVSSLLAGQADSALAAQLPMHALLNIFSNLKLSDVSSFSLSCKGFHLLSRDDVIWQNLFHAMFPSRLPTEILLRNGSYFEAFKDQHRLDSNLAHGMYASDILVGHMGTVSSIAFKEDEIFSGSSDCRIMVWDQKGGDCQATLTGHEGIVRCLAVGEEALISGSNDHTIKIWDLETLECIHTMTGHEDTVFTLAISEGKLFSGSGDGTIKIWDLKTKACLATLEGHEGWVRSLIVANGQLISGSADHTIRIWDIDTGECKAIFRGHEGVVRSIAFADGKLFTASSDNTIKVWDLMTEECEATLRGHEAAVSSLAIAEGKLFSGSEDHTVRIWDLKTRECLTAIFWRLDRVSCLGMSDGCLFTGSFNNTIGVWNFRVATQQVLQEIADLFKTGNPHDHAEAMARFARMSKKTKEAVYTELGLLFAFEQKEVAGFGEDAFHHRGGQSSTSEQKAIAIEKYAAAL